MYALEWSMQKCSPLPHFHRLMQQSEIDCTKKYRFCFNPEKYWFFRYSCKNWNLSSKSWFVKGIWDKKFFRNNGKQLIWQIGQESGWKDSNLRPPGPKPGALIQAELHPEGNNCTPSRAKTQPPLTIPIRGIFCTEHRSWLWMERRVSSCQRHLPCAPIFKL